MATKEQLEQKNAVLENSIQKYEAKDESIRKEISEALGNYKKEYKQFGNDEIVLNVLSWEQIFVRIGKLLEKQKALQYVEDIESLRLQQKENSIAIKELENNLFNNFDREF